MRKVQNFSTERSYSACFALNCRPNKVQVSLHVWPSCMYLITKHYTWEGEELDPITGIGLGEKVTKQVTYRIPNLIPILVARPCDETKIG
jgi:hypothetical protein